MIRVAVDVMGSDRGAAAVIDGAQRAAFAHRARSHVASDYTRDAMCARTIDIYEELLFPEAAAVTLEARQPLPVVA